MRKYFWWTHLPAATCISKKCIDTIFHEFSNSFCNTKPICGNKSDITKVCLLPQLLFVLVYLLGDVIRFSTRSSSSNQYLQCNGSSTPFFFPRLVSLIFLCSAAPEPDFYLFLRSPAFIPSSMPSLFSVWRSSWFSCLPFSIYVPIASRSGSLCLSRSISTSARTPDIFTSSSLQSAYVWTFLFLPSELCF